MKKVFAGLMAAAVLAGVAQAENVYSQNAVGFIRVEIQPGALAPIVYPFDILGSDVAEGIKFTEMQIANELPGGSQVYFWNGSSWLRSQKNKNAAIGWTGEAKTKVIADGEMFFVQPAGDTTLTEYTLAGEVPAAQKTVRSIDSSDPNRLNAVGSAYPTETTFKATTLAKDAPPLSEVYFWVNGSWVRSQKNKNAAIGWTGLASTKVLAPGEGFFIKFPSADVTSWEQDKPYAWP